MKKEIKNHRGETLDYSFHPSERHSDPQSEDQASLVVIGHGVTANKDREWAVTLAEALSKNGFSALRFSFSGNGESEGDFRDSCPSKEVQDLGAVLDAVERPVTYVGHSMGAAVGVLRAAKDPRIQALVSLGGMVDTKAFDKRKFSGLLPDQGYMWDLPACPYSRTFKEDMLHIGSVLPLAPQITIPWLLLHGSEDSVVPPEESQEIAKNAGGEAQLKILPGGDHVFSGPFAHQMANEVVALLNNLPT